MSWNKGNNNNTHTHTLYPYIFVLSFKHTSAISAKAVRTVLYRVSLEECARLRENVPNVKVHRYNPKHLYPNLNGYGENGQRSLKV